jgi:hypothetical protein
MYMTISTTTNRLRRHVAQETKITTDDRSRLVLALVAFQENLEETDDLEDLSPELLKNLILKLAAKLQVVPVSGPSQTRPHPCRRMQHM